MMRIDFYFFFSFPGITMGAVKIAVLVEVLALLLLPPVLATNVTVQEGK